MTALSDALRRLAHVEHMSEAAGGLMQAIADAVNVARADTLGPPMVYAGSFNVPANTARTLPINVPAEGYCVAFGWAVRNADNPGTPGNGLLVQQVALASQAYYLNLGDNVPDVLTMDNIGAAQGQAPGVLPYHRQGLLRRVHVPYNGTWQVSVTNQNAAGGDSYDISIYFEQYSPSAEEVRAASAR